MQELQSKGSFSGEAANVTHARKHSIHSGFWRSGQRIPAAELYLPILSLCVLHVTIKAVRVLLYKCFCQHFFYQQTRRSPSMISVNSFLPVLYLYIHITKVYGVLRGSGAQAVLSALALITSDGLVTRLIMLKTICTLGRMLLCLLPPVNNSTIPVTNQWFIIPIHNELTICSFPVMQCSNAPYCSYLLHHALIN